MGKDVRLICKQFIYKIEDAIPFQYNNFKNHRQNPWDPNFLDFQKHNKMDSVLPLQA